MLLFVPLALRAQEADTTKGHHNLRLNIEAGAGGMWGDRIKPEQVREERSSGYGYYDNNYGLIGGQGELDTYSFGVKPEYFIYKNRIGLSSGLRFSWADSRLESDRDSFLWRVGEQGLTTDYVRIKDIRQRSYMLSIPMEGRFFVNTKEYPGQFYVRAGASVNFRLSSNYQVNFVSATSARYDGLVRDQLPATYAVSAFGYGAVGLKFGKVSEAHSRTPWGSIEFQIPCFLLTKDTFAFVSQKNGFGIGVRASFDIPLRKAMPIGTSRPSDLSNIEP